MVSWLLSGAPNKDIDKIGRPPMLGYIALLGEPRYVNPEVAGSSPALVNFFSSKLMFI